MSNTKQYDVALSFAGEDRSYVEMVADGLRARNVKVFYDSFEEVDLWGKNLYDHLIDVYQKSSRYTVIFISRHYRDKVWANHERKASQARALNESYEYILPARFDDTEIEGLLPTIKFTDLRKRSPEEVSVLICQKLGHNLLQSKAHEVPSPQAPSTDGIATFNYSNFNGRFRIGEGLYIFETKWSKASNMSIHCYTDTSSIRGVALAPKGAKIADITDASALDYTSRNRAPERGRFVVLQNNNGFYAALEIVNIKDDTRGDESDELTFRYWILNDGTKDFSKVKAT